MELFVGLCRGGSWSLMARSWARRRARSVRPAGGGGWWRASLGRSSPRSALLLLRAHEELRQDVTRGESPRSPARARRRRASAASWARRTGAGRGKALEQARARQMDQAADSLRRLEAVVAGSATPRRRRREHPGPRARPAPARPARDSTWPSATRSSSTRCACPAAATCPIDSKWTSVAALERLDGREARRSGGGSWSRWRATCARASATCEVPRPRADALPGPAGRARRGLRAAPEAHGEGYREGVLVVPYSLALPYVLALYRLTLRFGGAVDTDQLAARLRSLDESAAQRSDEEVEGRLSRALVQLENARDALRDQLGGRPPRRRTACSTRGGRGPATRRAARPRPRLTVGLSSD